MAKTGDIYRSTEVLRDLAAATFADLEADDDLPSLQGSLQGIIDHTIALRDVVGEVDDTLTRLK